MDYNPNFADLPSDKRFTTLKKIRGGYHIQV